MLGVVGGGREWKGAVLTQSSTIEFRIQQRTEIEKQKTPPQHTLFREVTKILPCYLRLQAEPSEEHSN